MDIYSRKSRWKIYLAIAGVIIILISMFYTNFLEKELKDEERKKVNLFAIAVEQGNNLDLPLDYDLTLHGEIVLSNTTIPIIAENELGDLTGYNFNGDEPIVDQVFLAKQKEAFQKNGYKIEGIGDLRYVYFKNSYLVKWLAYLPFVQLLLISAFIAAGYFSFSTARRSEQNQVWAGMAKETAHQLGTPISAIIGWIEHLKENTDPSPDQKEVISELRNDVTRLELIADRFSKIGSAPVLEKTNIYRELDHIKNYMQRRAPRKVNFVFPKAETNPVFVRVNPPLFNWVLENLIRNALDAMEGSGAIQASVEEEGNMVNIHLSDTGQGIPANKFKTVFEPGFSTKTRGWGLGLSLAKRIIENYHKGKIFVSHSKIDEGSTFTIKLPKD